MNKKKIKNKIRPTYPNFLPQKSVEQHINLGWPKGEGHILKKIEWEEESVNDIRIWKGENIKKRMGREGRGQVGMRKGENVKQRREGEER